MKFATIVGVCGLLLVFSASCGTKETTSFAEISFEEMTAARSAYEAAFYKLDGHVEVTDAAFDDAGNCNDMPCLRQTADSIARAIRGESAASAELNLVAGDLLAHVALLVEVDEGECGHCREFANSFQANIAAERIYQAARTAENRMYVELLRCDTDECVDRVERRLDEDGVPRRAAAARRLHETQERLLDVENDLYAEMYDQ